MLAKLKYLKEEEKALTDIKNMITEQATRLKQEECYLKSLMRGSNPGFLDQSHKTILEQTTLVDDNSVNKVPLEDLQVQSPSQQQHYVKDSVRAEEEEEEEDEEDEEEEEEVEGGDLRDSQEEDGINTELLTLMQQMQEGEHYDDDSF